MKILHVIFSTNRIKYLMPTLESLKNLDYGNHTVDKLIIDDYPRNRNPAIFDLISKVYGFNLRFNETNLGLSVNWSAFFDWLKTQDYDYILHQEDDVLLTSPIRIDDLITIIESDEKMASVVLQRQSWYFHETEPVIDVTDVKIGNYYYSQNVKTFPIIFSLYRKNVIEYSFRDYWKFNVNEGMIMVYLNFFHQMYSATLKGTEGQNLIVHIGEETVGKRLEQGEPNWEQFSHMDPNRVYNSRNGQLIE